MRMFYLFPLAFLFSVLTIFQIHAAIPADLVIGNNDGVSYEIGWSVKKKKGNSWESTTETRTERYFQGDQKTIVASLESDEQYHITLKRKLTPQEMQTDTTLSQEYMPHLVNFYKNGELCFEYTVPKDVSHITVKELISFGLAELISQ